MFHVDIATCLLELEPLLPEKGSTFIIRSEPNRGDFDVFMEVTGTMYPIGHNLRIDNITYFLTECGCSLLNCIRQDENSSYRYLASFIV